jgi:hypothetical protein
MITAHVKPFVVQRDRPDPTDLHFALEQRALLPQNLDLAVLLRSESL